MKEHLKAIQISGRVWWVGAIDWGLREFHGYSTHRGSTYNAYLVMAAKPTLIDTVKAPFKGEMLARISSVVDPSEIKIVVSNHAEMDHSGCLPEIISLMKPEKVYASANGVKALDAHFRIGPQLTAVKTGDRISLGDMNLAFVETKMLHWPDSMVSYLEEENLLFSQDAFGMHLATDRIFEDENQWPVVEQEMRKYFANILLPYSQQILKQLGEFAKLNLPIKTIAPDHGPVWRRDIGRPLEMYKAWSEQSPESRAVIMYDTMWHSTERMAAAVADGVRSGGASAKVIPLDGSTRSDVATEALCAGALVVGSPTINNNMFPKTADVLSYLKGLRPKNLVGAAFGSFGWSGEAVPQVNAILKEMGVELLSDGVKAKYVPTEDDFKQCFDLGVRIGEALKSRAAAGKS